MRESQEFLNSPDWKKSKAEGDDIVEWLQPAPKARKIFKLTVILLQFFQFMCKLINYAGF